MGKFLEDVERRTAALRTPAADAPIHEEIAVESVVEDEPAEEEIPSIEVGPH